MPFISTKTNVTVSKDTEALLTKKLGEAITLLPGKTEEWLMLSLEDNCRMAFRGNSDGKYAMVEVKIFGTCPSSAYDTLTKALTEVYSTVLGIPGDGFYVKYEEVDRWGYDGFNF